MRSTGTEGDAPACIANIDRSERRRRLVFGLAALGLAMIAFVLLLATGTSRLWRLPLFLLLYPGAIGVFQWRDRTCVALAARSQRKLGPQAETIDDPEELAAVRRQASAVQRKSLAAAAGLLVLVLLIP